MTAAGVPVLALPPDVSGDLGQTVLVAWNGSREAARAAHDALPFLHEAKRVILCAVGDGGREEPCSRGRDAAAAWPRGSLATGS